MTTKRFIVNRNKFSKIIFGIEITPKVIRDAQTIKHRAGFNLKNKCGVPFIFTQTQKPKTKKTKQNKSQYTAQHEAKPCNKNFTLKYNLYQQYRSLFLPHFASYIDHYLNSSHPFFSFYSSHYHSNQDEYAEQVE